MTEDVLDLPREGGPCPDCNGDGESEESPLLPCPTCWGSGRAAGGWEDDDHD